MEILRLSSKMRWQKCSGKMCLLDSWKKEWGLEIRQESLSTPQMNDRPLLWSKLVPTGCTIHWGSSGEGVWKRHLDVLSGGVVCEGSLKREKIKLLFQISNYYYFVKEFSHLVTLYVSLLLSCKFPNGNSLIDILIYLTVIP